MRWTDCELLRAEIHTVEDFLLQTAEDSPIERLTWQGRLKVLRERLAVAEQQRRGHPLTITFRGSPVEGTRSIEAAFATGAVSAFADATRTLAAGLAHEELGSRGPLPGSGERALRILDTALGSFGFRLELPPPPPNARGQLDLFSAEDLAAETGSTTPDPEVDAIKRTLELIEAAAREDEEAISELAAEFHTRALEKTRAFAKVLLDHQATFSASFEGKNYELEDSSAVARAAAALKRIDLVESEETVVAQLVGVLPHSRDFEAETESETILKGKVCRSIDDLQDLADRWSRKKALLHLHVVTLRMNKRFVLRGISPFDQCEEGIPSSQG